MRGLLFCGALKHVLKDLQAYINPTPLIVAIPEIIVEWKLISSKLA